MIAYMDEKTFYDVSLNRHTDFP